VITIGQILLALHLVRLTGPDNQLVLINPEQVIALRDPRGRPGEHFHQSVHCLVFTADSKYTPVTETCPEVRRRLELLEQQEQE
jgi:hypothetical protein